MKIGDKILVNEVFGIIEFFDSGIVVVNIKKKIRYINISNIKFNNELGYYITRFIDWDLTGEGC